MNTAPSEKRFEDSNVHMTNRQVIEERRKGKRNVVLGEKTWAKAAKTGSTEATRDKPGTVQSSPQDCSSCQLHAINALYCCKEQSVWALWSPKTIDLDIAVQGDSVSCNCNQQWVPGNPVSCNCNENGEILTKWVEPNLIRKAMRYFVTQALL